MGAVFLGELSCVRAAVDRDGARAAEFVQALKRDVAEPANADQHAIGAGIEQLRRTLGGAEGCNAGIGHRRDVDRHDVRAELDQGAFVGLEIFGETAVQAKAGEQAVFAVHVLAMAAVQADAAGAKWMADDRIPRLHRGHAAADILNPARILMSHDVGEQPAFRVHHVAPHALDDVQVGAAEPGRPHLDDHFIRRVHGRRCDLLQLQLDIHLLVVVVEACRFHFSSLPSVIGLTETWFT